MNKKPFDLHGRVALVTGAGGLLGPEHAAALAQAGAKVILTDVTRERAQLGVDRVRAELPSAELVAEALDVTQPAQVRELAEAASKAHGLIDILVNNAAVDPKVTAGGPVESSRLEVFGVEEWRRQLDVGITGSFLCAQAFGARMAEAGHGVILNIASDLSVIAPDQRLYRKPGLADAQQPVKPVTYSVIKTALVGLTRYLATYWADRGVRCNALSPGGVYNEQPGEFVQRLASLIPMGRMAARDEYRGAVQFLCSDASSYMNGQNLVIDGGRSVL